MARQKQEPQEKSKRSRLWIRATVWLLAGVSTAWAAREVRRYVVEDSRFVMQGVEAGVADSDDFVVTGLHYTRREQVAAVFERDFGRNVFLIPIDERRRRLLAIDWVEEATVARVWPNRIAVRIIERVPVAFVHTGQTSKLALIDREGVILDQPARGRFSFPVLLGVSEDQPAAERATRVARLLRVTTDLGERTKKVSEIDVSSRDVRLTLDVDGRAIDLLTGREHFASRVDGFLANYPEIRKGSPHTGAFDLRVDGRILTLE